MRCAIYSVLSDVDTKLFLPMINEFSDNLTGITLQADHIHELHQHNELELALLEAGDMIYFLNGRQIRLSRNTLFIFWGALPHRILEASEDASLYCMTIPMKYFFQWQSPAFTNVILNGDPIMVPLDKSVVTGMLFRRWQRDLQARSPERDKILLLEVEACIRRLALNDAVQEVDDIDPVPAQSAGLRNVQTMTQFISEHYRENISVPDIADAAGLHPHYAMTLFREHLKMRISEYMIRYRLAHAARLLLTTGVSIQDLSPEVGFGSVNHFHTTFKKYYGTTPRLFRKEALVSNSDKKRTRRKRRTPATAASD